MMSLTRLKPQVAVGVALIFTIAGVAVQGRQQPAPQGAQEQVKPTPQANIPPFSSGAAALPDLATNRALARKQLDLIDKAWALMQDLAETHRIDIDSGTFGPWGRRLLETLRKAGAGKVEIVAALEKSINDLKKMEAIAKTWDHFDVARSRSTPLRVYEIEFLLMEAEIWLNEEKMR